MVKPELQHAHFSNNTHPDHFRYKAVAVAVAACFSANIALANPTAPTVVRGTATFQQAGSILNVTNSHNAIINWGSFSIGINELTKFIQPSALSAVLNRVVGQDPSAILGALQSNGRVFLINPNGIVFGAGAQINVAGLVASTLNLSNDDFLNNRMRFTDGAGAGSVVNQGSITGGSVYLVGNAVTNNGLITSPGGEVVLAAGRSVELVNPGTPNLRVEIVAPDNEARNLGTVTADAGRIGIYAGLINNSGTLNASSAVAEGGRILLKATKNAMLASTSVLDASGVGGGRIDVLADDTVRVDGRLDASAPMGGNGGFIETSGMNRVKIEPSAVVTTNAPQGKTGTWLIDPNNFVINSSAYGGDITGATLSGNLASTDVVITSMLGSGSYGGTQLGDILVQDTVSWNSANSLTLTAINDVHVDAAIQNAGTGGINLYAGWDGASSSATPTINNGVGQIFVHAPVSTLGTVQLVAGGQISQTSPITAAALKAVSLGGSVLLDGAENQVGIIAGSAVGDFRFSNWGRDLIIGSVGGVNGITVDNSVQGYSGQSATINVTVSGNALTVSQPVKAQGAEGSEGSGGSATINLTADRDLTVNAMIEARGGHGGGSMYGSGSGYGYAGGDATVSLRSNLNNVSVNSSVTTVGGNGIDGGRGGHAIINIDGGEGITIAGAVAAYGGHALGTGYDDGADGGEGHVGVTSGSSSSYGITITAAGSITAYGGNGGNDTSYAGYGGDGRINLYSNGPVQIAGPLLAVGGTGGNSNDSYYGSGGDGGDAYVSVSARDYMVGTRSVSVTNTGSITATGGTGGDAEGSEGGYGGYGGYAGINLAMGTYSSPNMSDFITIEGPLTATSGPGGSGTDYNGNAGSANVYLSAYGGGISINNTTVSAVAPGGPDGSEGNVSLYAPQGTINTATSTVSAQGVGYAEGGEGYYYYGYGSNVDFSAYGGITLGLVQSDGAVMIDSSNGAIIDGNAGLNILAPLAFLNGYGGVGTIANPLETQVAELAVSAYGGEIGVINSGNLFLLQANIQNGNAAIGTTGSLMVEGGEGYGYGYGVSAENGNLALFANGNMDLRGDVYASGDLVLNAGGNLTVGGGSYYTDVWGENSLNAVAGGNLDLLAASYGGRSWLGSYGLTTIKTGGNLQVDRSTIYGYPDVVMNVGGVININGTVGYGGSIEAGSPTTIHLTFPMLESGGYSVNGIAGLVYDPATNTGFFADGSPAVLGQNLLVTYGGAPVLNIPTNTLIVAMNESIKPPDPGENRDAFDDEKDIKKKKETQSCR